MCKQIILSFILVMKMTAGVAQPTGAEQGILDLRSMQEEFDQVSLAGEWEFYWQQYIAPGQFDYLQPDLFGKVPAYWTSYKEVADGITGKGYATYRLRILLPPGFHDSLALAIPIFDTSYELYIDGQKAAANGQTGRSEQTSAPSYFPLFHNFVYAGDTMELVVHVANFSHRRGGFWMDMKLGTAEFMQKKNERKKVINYSLLGILLGTFVLFFVFFLFEKDRPSFLFFSLASLGIFLRLANTGNYPGNFFVEQSWIWTVRFEYLGTFAALTFGVLYLDQFFRSRVMHRIAIGNALVFSVLSLFVMVSKPAIFSYVMFYFFLSGIYFLGYYLWRSFAGMIKWKHPDTVFFFSMVFILLAGVNDTLVSMSISPFNTEYLVSLTFLLIIIVQISILIDQWISTYREKISIHKELAYVNQNLEKIIAERTSELHRSNEELKETLDLKYKLFSIIAHDLKSPVASLVQYAELMLEKFRDSENKLIISELQRLAASSLDLIDNLLHWGNQQGRNIRYQPGSVSLYEIINSTAQLMKYTLESKKLTLNIMVPDDLNAWCDSTLLHICLRNLLSNALKFTPRDGEITIIASAEKETVTITVQDSGIGIDQERLRTLLSAYVESTPGTSGERGTGLGLIVVNELVRINKGTLTIESKPGRGTSAKFTLPGKP